MKTVRRLLVTLAVAALVVLLRTTPQPGAHVSVFHEHETGNPSLTLAGTGLSPFFACFGLFGLAAIGLKPGRAPRLRVAAPFVAVAIALVQSAFLVAWSRHATSFERPLEPQQILLFGAGGTVALILLGALGSGLGFGSGYLVALAADMLAQDPGHALLHGVLALVLGLILSPFLAARRNVPLEGIPPTIFLRLLPAGIVPLGIGLAFAALPGALARAVGIHVELLEWPVTQAGLGAAAAGFFTFFVVALSSNPAPLIQHAAARARLASAKPLLEAFDEHWLGAIAPNAALLGAVALSRPLLVSFLGVDPVPVVYVAAIGAATLCDAREEIPFPSSVVLGEAPGLLEADRIQAALRDAGIACYVRGAASRSLLNIFGLFVPLEVRVRPEDEERARAVIESEAPFLVGSPGLLELPPQVAPASPPEP